MRELEKLISEESIILTDTSIYDAFCREWYERVSRCRHSWELDEAALTGALANYCWIEGTLNRRNRRSTIYTTPKIAAEMRKFERIVQDKIEYLKAAEGNIDAAHRIIHLCNRKEIKMKLLEDTCRAYKEICDTAEKYVFAPFRAKTFARIYSAIIAVAENTDAKRDYGPANGGQRKKGDNHADEELVATAVYIATAMERSCCIITSDTDIRRILNNARSLLSQSNDIVCTRMNSQLNRKPIAVHFISHDGNIFPGSRTAMNGNSKYHPAEQIDSETLSLMRYVEYILRA